MVYQDLNFVCDLIRNCLRLKTQLAANETKDNEMKRENIILTSKEKVAHFGVSAASKSKSSSEFGISRMLTLP